RVAPGDTPAAIFAHPHGFDCSGRERRWGAGDFWVLSARLPTEGGQRSLVRSASVYQEAATLYARGDDGRIARNAFDRHNAWQRLRIGAFFELPIPVADTRTVQLLWRVEGTTNTRGVVLNPRLLTVGEGQHDDLMLTAFYAGFAGLCLSLLLSNFALWRALRQGYHPYYCAMILSLLVYAASSSGWLGIVTGMDNNIRLKLNIALLGGAIADRMAKRYGLHAQAWVIAAMKAIAFPFAVSFYFFDSVPVALGERLYSRWDFKPFFERGAIDIAQPDLSHAGGISEGRRIAAMAEAAVEMLLTQVRERRAGNDVGEDEDRVLEHELVVRESAGLF
ncbi:hypothetical protein LTR94_027848, partial [Friedmanniomyces endolithicus]